MEELRSSNSDYLKVRNDFAKKDTTQAVEDRMVVQNGLDPEVARTTMERAEGNETSDRETAQAADKLANGALETQKIAQPKGADKVSENWISQSVELVRTKIREGFEFAFNNRPKNLNPVADAILKEFYGWKQYFDVGKTADGRSVMVGDMAAQSMRVEVRDLWSKEKEQGSKMGLEEFSTGLWAISNARGKDWNKYSKELRTYVDENEASEPILKQLRRVLDMGDEVYHSSLAREYVKKTHADLDVIGDDLIKRGVLKGDFKKEDYFPNMVAFEDQTGDLFEKAIYGKKVHRAIFTEGKKFENGLESMKNGFIPEALHFEQIYGNYLTRVGRSLRTARLADRFKEQASMPLADDRKGRVSISADEEAGMVVRAPKNDAEAKSWGLSEASQWEVPKTGQGNERYKDAGALNHMFKGLYVHPEVYKGLKHVYSTGPDLGGFGKALWRANSAWKTVTLAGSFFHGVSVGQKAMSLDQAQGLKMGLNMGTVVGEGLSALGKGTDFPILLELTKGGFSLHQQDMIGNPLLSRNYDFKTGEKTLRSKASDIVNSYTNFFHDKIFEKFHPGIKIGLGIRMVKSDWFKKIEAEQGRSHAMEVTSKILNDTFGGQNLEYIGRSKLAQSVLQGVFLAPDWQESKMKRLFGTALAEDPKARRSFQIALGMEMALVLVAKIAMQQAMGAMTGETRTMEEIAEDVWTGKLGSVYLGKTKEDKPRDLFLNFAGSANQDWRPILAIAKGIYETPHDPKALSRELKAEFEHKFSPVMSAYNQLQTHMTPRELRKEQARPPSAFDYPLLPIGASQAAATMAGGLPITGSGVAERAIDTLMSQIASTVGAPLQPYTSLETKAKAKQAEAKAKKKEEDKKGKLTILK